MHIRQINEVTDHRISGGSTYQWDCYGTNARYVDYESEHADISVIFDTSTQEIYEVSVVSKNTDIKPYRWLDPTSKHDYMAECKQKNINPDVAWDDVEYVDLETEEDFLDKAKKIFNGEEFDERIQVPITLDDDELLILMKIAHERDITFNKLIEDILLECINKSK